MLPTLPITYVIYLTTEGFGGCSTLYQAVLDHTDAQLPLSSFRAKLASIKITPGREFVADQMKSYLEKRGFTVITATAPWTRGKSHYSEYLLDMRRVSQHSLVLSNPFVFLTDHDYPILCHKDPLVKVLARMCKLLEASPDTLSVRFQREEDLDTIGNTSIAMEPEQDLWWSKDWNLQPMLMRSLDYYRGNKIIEDHWQVAKEMHGEALWRDVLAPFSRSPKKHAVWLPEYAQVANLGVPEYLEVAKRFNLTIAPNPSI